MKNKNLHFFNLVWAACLLLNASCSMASSSAAENLLVASTPAHDSIKSIFRIPADKKIDFIRWTLALNKNQKFNLNINFGEGQPNTSGFKGGGERLTLNGNFSQIGNIYQLKSEGLSDTLSFVKLNDNLFHLLTGDGKLMVGNGGWSYTLSRKDLVAVNAPVSWKSNPTNNTAQETIFDGRTPCLDFARQYNLEVGSDCFKLKWKLTLFRDAITNEPTTYKLQRTLHRQSAVEGKWTIKKNSAAVIYQLDPDQPNESISFLVGDENVLFFLDKENQLLTGNSDFSFTLNRRK